MKDKGTEVWVMTSTRLVELLRRAYLGENPDEIVLAEYANGARSVAGTTRTERGE